MKKIAFLSLLVFLFTGCDGFLDSENLVKKGYVEFSGNITGCIGCVNRSVFHITISECKPMHFPGIRNCFRMTVWEVELP